MNKLLLAPLLLIFLVSLSYADYIGNMRSKIFHKKSCVWGQKVSLQNYVNLKTKESAKGEGFRPCKICRP